MSDDPRQAADQYRRDREAAARGEGSTADAEAPAGSHQGTSAPTAAQRAAFIETALQQAIRRGDFDDLPGAGKPLDGLTDSHDPDWWIRRKIATEQLSGLGPPALALRVEHREMEARLDALSREDDVREVLADFNHRVIEARRQLLGGPPVVTPTREVEAELAAWRARRRERQAAPPTAAPAPARRWWQRRR
ncbi:DUF1992 domain-containing protein [Microbacterium sp. P05]|uniref:DnaJ family domain-containing protein n=1 Tax=Microbacterium sp. P05 TaxID=3366948 RepID=UPI003745EE29